MALLTYSVRMVSEMWIAKTCLSKRHIVLVGVMPRGDNLMICAPDYRDGNSWIKMQIDSLRKRT